MLDKQTRTYTELTEELKDTSFSLDHFSTIPNRSMLAYLLESQEYAVLLIDEDFENNIKGLDIVRFVQNAYPDVEVIYFAAEMPKTEKTDTFRFFKKPLVYSVLATNIRLAARKNHIAKRKKRALLALHDASKSIIKSESEDGILRKVVDLASTIMDTSRSPGHFSHLALLNDSETMLVFNEAHHSRDVWLLLQNKLTNNVIDLANPQNNKIGIVGRVIRERQSQRQGNVHDDSDYIYLHREVNSQLAVPIKIEDRIFGVINVEHPDKNAFDENDQSAIEALAALVGVAIEKVRPNETERKQSKALKVLHEMGEVINGSISLTRDQIIWEAVKHAKNLMLEKGDGYLSHFAVKEGRKLVFHSVHNFEFEYQLISDAIDGVINLDAPPSGKKGLIGRAVETFTTQSIGNVHIDQDYIEFSPDVNSQLAVPIIINREVFGALNIEHPNYDAFDNNDKENLEILATKLAIALKNSKIYHQEIERSQRLEELYKTGQMVAKSDNLKNTLENIARQALSVTGNSVGTLVAFSHVSLLEGSTLKILASSPPTILNLYRDSIEAVIDIRESAPQKLGISGVCLKTGNIWNIPDVGKEPYYIKITDDTKSQLSVPLIYDDTPIGVISIESNQLNAFSSDDANIVSLLAQMAVIAIKNAQLHEENRQQREQAKIRLAQSIEKHFNTEEIYTLAFDLNVAMDQIPGDSRSMKARQLVDMMDRHGRMSELLEMVNEKRPSINL